MFTVWHSTGELADYLIANTELRRLKPVKRKLVESDASKPREFHGIPTHIKQILYLDAPDVIIEHAGIPVLAIELTSEAGTGHNPFQRFGRIAATAERRVPVFYVFPAGKLITRRGSPKKYDELNPQIYTACERLIELFQVPCFVYLFPSGYPDRFPPFPGSDSKGLLWDTKWRSCPLRTSEEMQAMFRDIDTILQMARRDEPLGRALFAEGLRQRRELTAARAFPTGYEKMSPLSAVKTVKTTEFIDLLRRSAGPKHDFGYLLPSRDLTEVYQADAKFRSDPYPGSLAAIDYIRCRTGPTYEDRCRNLAMVWGKLTRDASGRLKVLDTKGQTIEDLMGPIRELYKDRRRVLLWKRHTDLKPSEVSRYYMQVRFGTTFSKKKEIRMYAYFADAIVFPDGALWREG